VPDEIVRVELVGHLTAEKLKVALAKAEASPAAKIALLVDCLTMTGYDGEARALFVGWHKGMQRRVTRTAIVLNQPFWRIVISAMSLASSAPMHAFDTYHDAEKWLALPLSKRHGA
jgi:hypothetical protein